MVKLYLLSKKIHRILVLIISVLTIFMALTGAFLKYPFIAKYLLFIDLGLMRSLHNNISPLFSLALFSMIITGVIMYVFPLLKKK